MLVDCDDYKDKDIYLHNAKTIYIQSTHNINKRYTNYETIKFMWAYSLNTNEKTRRNINNVELQLNKSL